MSRENLLRQIRRVEALTADAEAVSATIVVEFTPGCEVDKQMIEQFITDIAAERLIAPTEISPYGETTSYHGVIAAFSRGDPPALVQQLRTDIIRRAREAGAEIVAT